MKAERSVPEGAVRLYLEHLRARNLRNSTVYNRWCALRRLSEYFGGPVLYLNEGQLRAWQNARTTQITPAARASELSNVCEFFRWALTERLRDDDPTVRLARPRTPRRMPRPIPDGQIAAAMVNAPYDIRVVLGLAAFAGLRACEISRLDFSEVGYFEDPPMIRINEGKGGKGRLVPLAPSLAEMLLALPHQHGPVIRGKNGNRSQLLPHRISQLANIYLHANGVPGTLHQLRHRFATSTYRACRDIRAVQELMGHSSPATTAIYAAASPQVALEAVLSASTFAA